MTVRAEAHNAAVAGVGHEHIAAGRVDGHTARVVELVQPWPAGRAEAPQQPGRQRREVASRLGDGRLVARLRPRQGGAGQVLVHGRRDCDLGRRRQGEAGRYLVPLQRKEVSAVDDGAALARRLPPELHLAAAAQLVVTHLDVVEALLQGDLAAAVLRAVAAAVVHHQLAVDEDEGAVVGASADGVQAAGGCGQLAPPQDAERLTQRVVGGDQQVVAHQRRRALPVGVGEIVAH